MCAGSGRPADFDRIFGALASPHLPTTVTMLPPWRLRPALPLVIGVAFMLEKPHSLARSSRGQLRRWRGRRLGHWAGPTPLSRGHVEVFKHVDSSVNYIAGVMRPAAAARTPPCGRHCSAADQRLGSYRWRCCAAAAAAAALLKVQHLQRPHRTASMPSLTRQLRHAVNTVSMAALLWYAAAAPPWRRTKGDLLLICVCVLQRQATACDGKP